MKKSPVVLAPLPSSSVAWASAGVPWEPLARRRLEPGVPEWRAPAHHVPEPVASHVLRQQPGLRAAVPSAKFRIQRARRWPGVECPTPSHPRAPLRASPQKAGGVPQTFIRKSSPSATPCLKCPARRGVLQSTWKQAGPEPSPLLAWLPRASSGRGGGRVFQRKSLGGQLCWGGWSGGAWQAWARPCAGLTPPPACPSQGGAVGGRGGGGSQSVLGEPAEPLRLLGLGTLLDHTPKFRFRFHP